MGKAKELIPQIERMGPLVWIAYVKYKKLLVLKKFR
jgi:hypothetical protein